MIARNMLNFKSDSTYGQSNMYLEWYKGNVTTAKCRNHLGDNSLKVWNGLSNCTAVRSGASPNTHVKNVLSIVQHFWEGVELLKWGLMGGFMSLGPRKEILWPFSPLLTAMKQAGLHSMCSHLKIPLPYRRNGANHPQTETSKVWAKISL